MKNELIEAAKDSVKESMKANPYGFLPMVVNPAASAIMPYIIPAALGAGAVWYFMSNKSDEPKKPTAIGSLFSGPVFIGAGLGYAAGSAMKADNATRFAYSAVGLGLGWTIQHYLIAPSAYEQEYAREKKEEADEARWYKPWTW